MKRRVIRRCGGRGRGASARLGFLLAVAMVMATEGASEARQRRDWEIDILRDTFHLTPDSPLDAEWADLRQACPRRDCIPAIDRPEFVSVADAGFLRDDDLVLGFAGPATARAYPIFLLDRHEIVNDVVDDTPVAITWCPLCGSGLAFRRELDGRPVEFGVSGLLRENDLILYDRATESLWQQITATAIAGSKRGARLTTLPVATAKWSAWRAAHPTTEVLVVRDGEGQIARLDRPYGDYDQTTRLLFPVRNPSDLAHPKTVVYGIEVGEGSIAVTERALVTADPIELEVGGVALSVRRSADGTVGAVRDDGVEVAVHRMFWFAWATFHPGTLLRDADGADRRAP